jgi:hypothetical protein
MKWTATSKGERNEEEVCPERSGVSVSGSFCYL